MKQAWTRLSSMILKQGGNKRFMQPRFEGIFLRHHKHANEIIMNPDGKPLAAIYFTPDGMNREWRKVFFAEVGRRMDLEEPSDE